MTKELKTLIFDIETGAGVNGFKPDLSVALCIGYKWLHEKTAKCLSVLDQGRDLYRMKIHDWDRDMLQEFSSIANEADIIVGHYSSIFDKKYLNGRLLLHGLPPMYPAKHIDTCMALRTISNFSSNRLKHAAKILKLSSQKHENGWPDWWIEVGRNPVKMVKAMIPYCKGDVLATEELYKVIQPFLRRKGFSRADRGFVCPKCGSKHLQRKGKHVTASSTSIRLHCQDCGSWSLTEAELKKPLVKDM